MKFLTTVLALSAAVAFGAIAQETRIWTSASGNTLEAAFVANHFGQVVLQKPDGERIKINFNQLSGADQIYVNGLTTPALVPPGAAPSPPTDVPPALAELFGKRLENARGKKVSAAELDGKKIGIYFSASWCPPCRAFTPQLVAAYNQLKAEGKPFEVVLVTHDRDEASMRGYMKSHDMPWLAVPFGDKHLDELKRKFGVAGIPTLVVVDSSGKTLSKQARGEIAANGAKAFDDW